MKHRSSKIICALLLMPFICSGQSYIGGKIFTNLSYPSTTGKPLASISGGIFIQEPLTNKFSLRQELLFKREGFYSREYIGVQTNGSGDTIGPELGNKKTCYQFTFIEVPLLALYKIGNKNIKPYFGGGASLKILVYSKKKMFSGSTQMFEPIEANGDLSLIGFIGAEFKVKDIPFHIELRSSNGISSVYSNTKFRSTALMIGFKI